MHTIQDKTKASSTNKYTRPGPSAEDFAAYVDAWTSGADLAVTEDRRHLGDLLIEALRRNDRDSIRTIASALVIS